MKALSAAAAALVAATFAAPVSARADTADDAFVADVHSMGISASRAALVQAGHDICGLMAQAPAGDAATSAIALADVVMLEVPSVTDLRDADEVVVAAVSTYCPPG